MSNKRIQVTRLDPMTRATPDEVALVVEQGNRYLQDISSKRQKLYKMYETFVETIEGVSLRGVRYDKTGEGLTGSAGQDSVYQVLITAEKQTKEHEKMVFEDLLLLSYEEEKFMAICRSYTSLRIEDVRMLEEFYAEGREAKDIIHEIFHDKYSMKTFWSRKSIALKKAADKCTYQPPQ